MPEQTYSPLVIEDVHLTLAGTEYADALDSITLTPTTATVTRPAVNGKRKHRAPKPSWVLDLSVGQDFDKASLTAQLIQKHGQVVPFELRPNGTATTAAKISGNVMLLAGAIGGAAEGVAASTVSLPVEDQPAFVWNNAATAGA